MLAISQPSASQRADDSDWHSGCSFSQRERTLKTGKLTDSPCGVPCQRTKTMKKTDSDKSCGASLPPALFLCRGVSSRSHISSVSSTRALFCSSRGSGGLLTCSVDCRSIAQGLRRFASPESGKGKTRGQARQACVVSKVGSEVGDFMSRGT